MKCSFAKIISTVRSLEFRKLNTFINTRFRLCHYLAYCTSENEYDMVKNLRFARTTENQFPSVLTHDCFIDRPFKLCFNYYHMPTE